LLQERKKRHRKKTSGDITKEGLTSRKQEELYSSIMRQPNLKMGKKIYWILTRRFINGQ
jgi:hypothetical protein